MGYHLTITRESKDKASDISRDEWNRLAALNGEFLFVEPTDSWVWTKDQESCLWYNDKNKDVWTKNPGDDFHKLLIELAAKLDARVRGDDGEYYKTSIDDYYYVEDGKLISRNEKEIERATEIKNLKTRRLAWNIIRWSLAAAVIYLFMKKHF